MAQGDQTGAGSAPPIQDRQGDQSPHTALSIPTGFLLSVGVVDFSLGLDIHVVTDSTTHNPLNSVPKSSLAFITLRFDLLSTSVDERFSCPSSNLSDAFDGTGTQGPVPCPTRI